MKSKPFLLTVGLLLAATLAASTLLAQNRRSRASKEFMREKLDIAQSALEGLALEDYDLIIARSQKLSAMSQAAPWQVFENPEYVEHSASFRRHADAMTRAGRAKNLEAATLAYMRLTMSCVDCHKFVRGKLVARAPAPGARAAAVALAPIQP